MTALRRSSFLTWAPTDVQFSQRATGLCPRRGASSWRVSSSPAPGLMCRKKTTKPLHTSCTVPQSLNQLILLAGLPHFSVEPQHMFVVANVSMSLSCVAHGPPEPVRVIWLQDGSPLNSLADPVALSPSTLNLTGINYHTAPNATLRQFSLPLNNWRLKHCSAIVNGLSYRT